MRIPFALKFYPFVIIPLLFGIYFLLPLKEWGNKEKNLHALIQLYRKSGQSLNAVLLELEKISVDTQDRDFHYYLINDYYNLDYAERTIVQSEFSEYKGNLNETYKQMWDQAHGDELILLSTIRILLCERTNADHNKVIDEITERLKTETNAKSSKWYSGLMAVMSSSSDIDGRIKYWKQDWNSNGPSYLSTQQLCLYLLPSEGLIYADSARKNGIPVNLSTRMRLGWDTSPFQFIRVLTSHILESISSLNGFVFWMGMGIWLMFMIAVDVFKDRPKWWPLFLVFCSLFNILFFTLFLPFFDWDYFHFSGLLSDIIQTGIPEECTKFLPVLLCRIFFKTKIRPAGYLFLGMLSSLMFALIENTYYYHGYFHSGIIAQRTMIGITMHIGLSFLPAYAMIISDNRNKSRWLIPAAFFLAAILHGMYNFLVGQHILYGILILLLLSMAFGSALNNALNLSDSFYEKTIPHNRITVLFSIGFCTIWAWQYLFTGMEFGWDVSQQYFRDSIAQYGFLIVFIPFSLSRIELHKSNWTHLDFLGERSIIRKTESQGLFQLRIVDSKAQSLFPIVVQNLDRIVKDKKGIKWHLFANENDTLIFLSFIEEGDTFYDFNVGVWIKNCSEKNTSNAHPDQASFNGRGYISPAENN